MGVWFVTVELPPGTHLYSFVVDGQRGDDPDCTMLAPNPYRRRDCVRQVP